MILGQLRISARQAKNAPLIWFIEPFWRFCTLQICIYIKFQKNAFSSNLISLRLCPPSRACVSKPARELGYHFFANDNHDNATPPMTLLSHIFGDCYLICMKSLAVSHSLHCESQLQVTQSGFRLIWWNRKVTKTSFTFVGQGETPSLHQCEQRINVRSGTLALVWWSWCAPWGCTTRCNCSVWLGGSKVQLLEHWAAQ